MLHIHYRFAFHLLWHPRSLTPVIGHESTSITYMTKQPIIQMNMSKWTLGLLSVGAMSLPGVLRAEEASQHILTALSSTTLSGYVDTTASWKFGTGNTPLPGRVYDGPDTQDGFNMNVVSLTLDKPLDEAEWSSGYHTQLLLGPGASKRGTGLVANSATTGVAFNEAYVALRAPVGNGINFKVGQFGTYNGFEAFDTYKNPNWSRSYGFYIESSAHTGISASYQFSESIGLMLGIGNTASFSNQVDARSTSESSKAYLAMLSLTAPESFGFLKGATLSAGYTGGVNNGVTGPRVENLYVGATIPTPWTGFKVGLAYDYTADIPTAVTQRGSYANATAVYVMYETGKWKFNNRADYATGSAGAYGIGGKVAGAQGDKFLSDTFTADYALWKNVISRAEFRWDHSLNSDRPFGGPDGTASRKNVASLTANIIYLF